MIKSAATVLFLILLAGAVQCGEPLPATPPALVPAETTEPLPGTELLMQKGDLSRDLVEGNDRFLDRQLAQMVKARESHWPDQFKSHQTFEGQRLKLRERLGIGDDSRIDSSRITFPDSESSALTFHSVNGLPVATFDLKGDFGKITVREISWPVLDGVRGRGFLIEPETFWTQVIAIPDTSQNPIELIWPGSKDGEESPTTPYALQLAMAGARVVVPTRIRRFESNYTLTDREWLARPAFELGRTLISYEVEKLFGLVEAGTVQRSELRYDPEKKKPGNWNIIGWGDGGMLALYAAALAQWSQFDTVCISGYFGNREELWKEPFDHHVFGLLEEFGDAEIAALTAPRKLIIESATQPNFRYRTLDNSRELDFQTSYTASKGKPGRSSTSTEEEITTELKRLRKQLGDGAFKNVEWSHHDGRDIAPETLAQFVMRMGRDDIELPDLDFMARLGETLSGSPNAISDMAKAFLKFPPEWGGGSGEQDLPYFAGQTWIDSEWKREEEREELERHIQRELVESDAKRRSYFKDLNTKSLENFEETIEPYREKFRTEVIGDFEIPLEAPNPRTRPYQETELTISYEVVLDVFDEVFAYGILTLPKSLPLDGSEKRPVVVCQHGLEGSPQDLVGEQKFKAYKAFATRLAERGFITFAPQNGYKYFDHFRMQQFKAQTMGKTLFSIIVPQHRQITEWLAARPFVDGDKIGFYGLSYGGKAAMRIPPLVDRYCLSICSGDFNEWVWKNAATDEASLRYSYANKGEYEMFEWNLGGTFNYAEMAALICPRPFMVERGHFDGVAPDEKVGYEFAKVRRLYSAQLGIGDRCEIEWFPGPHTINGVGTFDFLHRHLDWPKQ
ncbi:hypothetical protein VSU19_00360 [Verrucomicrobiales bacterium BCK34]|nr:hypothetical protein [Verrucomicrobiales bacterium BCK34]